MDMLFSLILIAHVIMAVAIIVLVLLQHGKGADMGAAFGSGSSGSLFGATGSANFLSRTTGILAAVFFVSSLALTFVATHRGAATSPGVMGTVKPAADGAEKAAGKAAEKAAEKSGDNAAAKVPTDAAPAKAPEDAQKSDAASKGTDVPK